MSVDIVLISGSFAPREGGAEKQLRATLSKFADEGHQVVVLTQIIPGAQVSRKDVIDGIRVHRLGSSRMFQYRPRLGMLFFLAKALFHSARLRPSKIISLQLGAATAAASITSRVIRVPHVIRLTGGGSSEYKSEPFARRDSLLGRMLFRLISRHCTTLVAPAKHLVNDFLECLPAFPGRTLQIINGVEKKSLASVEREAQVVWYSRRGSEKSYETFKAVAEALPHVTFVVIGHFNETNIPLNVISLGWQDDPEYVLAQSRVLLNTSPAEGMPNTVLQAIAYGCRVVGLDNEGMREVREMFPGSVQLAGQSETTLIAEYVREALGNSRPVLEAVPSTSEVFEQWSSILIDKGNNK